MKQKITLSILLLLSCHIALAQVPPALQQKLQDTLNYMKTTDHYKGLSVSVGYKSLGIWKSAVGESAPGVNLSTDDLIGIGSNTKTFISAMMLKLVESGQVHLTDTIGTWMNGYPFVNGQITIRQVLNHTSGIASYTNNVDFWDSVNVDLNRLWTKPEIFTKFVTAPTFTAGSSWEYSNTNYLIAGYIEEQILGQPIHQILRDSIINPLSLTHTFFPPYETATFPYAQVYTDLGLGYTFWMFPYNLNTTADAAGALVSNAEDNTKFWQALMKGQIIKKSTLKDSMLNWVTLSSTFGYGLGIMKAKYFGNTVFSHGGTWIGQLNSNLADTTRDIYITVLSNQDSLDNSRTEEVVAALYKVVLDYVPTAVVDIHSNSSLAVYPNPANDLVYIKHQSAIHSISVSDMSGKLIYQEKILSPSKQVQLNVKNYKDGVYLLHCNDEKKGNGSTFIVQH